MTLLHTEQGVFCCLLVHRFTPSLPKRHIIYDREGLQRAEMASKLGSCDRKALIMGNLTFRDEMLRETLRREGKSVVKLKI